MRRLERWENAKTWAIKRERLLLVLAVALALAIRVAYIGLVVGFNSPAEYDGIAYNNWAIEALEKHTYTLNGEPTAMRPPGYHLVLAAVYSLTGFCVAAARLIQAIASALTCAVVYHLGKRLFGAQVGLLALLGMVFYPLFVYMAGEFYPDTLAILPLWLALLVASSMTRDGRWGLPFATGLLLGATIMLRTTASLMLPLLGLWQLLYFPWRRALRNAVLLAAGWFLVFAPWIARNYIVFHEFIPIASVGSIWGGANPLSTLAKGQAVPFRIWAGTDPQSEQLLQDLREAHGGASVEEIFGSEPPQRTGPEIFGWPGLTETQTSRRMNQLAVRWIRANPGEFARLIPWKIMRAWEPASYVVAFSRTHSAKFVTLVTPPWILFLLLALFGFVRSFRERRKLFILYAAPIAVTLMAAVYGGATRHALFMHPSLILFAAAGVSGVLESLGRGMGSRGRPLSVENSAP